jgi:hypothetical protein
MMKTSQKFTFLAVTVLLMGISGCNSGSSVAENATSDEASGSVVGDDKAKFDAQFGPGEDNEDSPDLTFTYYYEPDSLDSVDFILAYFMDDSAGTVSLQFAQQENAPDDLYPDQAESIAIAESFLPSDYLKLEEGAASDMLFAIQYQSEQLASNLEESQFLGATPGAVIVTLQHEVNQPDEVFGAVIKLGDQP